jgi:GTP cyclohydrolase IA
VGGVDLPRAQRAVEELLRATGHDPADPTLRGTPERVAAFAAAAWPGGAPMPVLDAAGRMPAPGDGAVALEAIPFRSVCEHHLLPFSGTADVVYRPGGWIVGIGGVVRVVDDVARRLQVQERLVEQVADVLQAGLEPAALLVRLRATHACLWARGIGDAGTTLTTTAARGAWAHDVAEPLALLAGPAPDPVGTAVGGVASRGDPCAAGVGPVQRSPRSSGADRR